MVVDTFAEAEVMIKAEVVVKRDCDTGQRENNCAASRASLALSRLAPDSYRCYGG